MLVHIWLETPSFRWWQKAWLSAPGFAAHAPCQRSQMRNTALQFFQDRKEKGLFSPFFGPFPPWQLALLEGGGSLSELLLKRRDMGMAKGRAAGGTREGHCAESLRIWLKCRFWSSLSGWVLGLHFQQRACQLSNLMIPGLSTAPPLRYSTLKSELRPIGPGRRPSGEDLLLKCLSTTGHWVQLPPTPDFPTQAG